MNKFTKKVHDFIFGSEPVDGSVALKKIEKKTVKMETTLSKMEGQLDPLKVMVTSMLSEKFWKHNGNH